MHEEKKQAQPVGKDAFWIALRADDWDTLRDLQGFVNDRLKTPYTDDTPLGWALYNNKVALARFLVNELDADVNAVSKVRPLDGGGVRWMPMTPLLFAEHSCPELVDLIKEKMGIAEAPAEVVADAAPGFGP